MTLIAHPPSVVHWCARSAGHGDCGVAAIAMACGVTYEVALTACLLFAPDVLKNGLHNHQVKRIVAMLGYDYHRKTLRRTTGEPTFDVDEDSGILAVKQLHVEDSGHYVYLWEGRIIEPSYGRQQLWLSARDYLAHFKYTATDLLLITRRDK